MSKSDILVALLFALVFSVVLPSIELYVRPPPDGRFFSAFCEILKTCCFVIAMAGFGGVLLAIPLFILGVLFSLLVSLADALFIAPFVRLWELFFPPVPLERRRWAPARILHAWPRFIMEVPVANVPASALVFAGTLSAAAADDGTTAYLPSSFSWLFWLFSIVKAGALIALCLAVVLVSRWLFRRAPAVTSIPYGRATVDRDFHSYVRRIFRPEWFPSFTWTWAAKFRVFCGYTTLYTSVRCPGLVRTFGSVTVRAVAGGYDFVGLDDASRYHGTGSAFVRSGSPFAASGSVRFLFLRRYFTARTVFTGRDESFVSHQVLQPLGWGFAHFWSPHCEPLDRACAYHRVGTVLVACVGDSTEMRFETALTSVHVPTAVLLAALMRYSLAAKAGQYATVTTALRDYPDAHVYAMALAAARHFELPSSLAYHLDCDATTAFDAEYDDKVMPLETWTNPVLSSSLIIPHTGGVSLEHSIAARVVTIASTTSLSSKDAAYCNEFLDLIAPAAPLTPLSYDDMSSRMRRPTQQAELWSLSTIYSIVRDRFSFFLKSEPVAPSKPARLIAAVKGSHNYELACFTLPLAEYMEQFAFWAPSKPPQTIQGAVRMMHQRAMESSSSVFEGDYAKFDATVGPCLAAFMALLFSRFFGAVEGSRASAIAGSEFFTPSASRYGGVYTTGSGTISGSASTTVRNTLWNCFVIYAAFRDDGYEPSAAFAALDWWLFSGDDSLGVIGTDSPIVAAKRLGMRLEGRLYTSGPTRFLGRFYPDPWSTECCIADVPRFLSRFHILRVPSGRSVVDALVQRSLGHMVNDAVTPLVGDLARAVLRQYPGQRVLRPEFFDQYHLDFMASGAYKTPDLSDSDLMHAIAEDMKCDVVALHQLRSEFSKVRPVVGAEYSVLSDLELASGTIFAGVPVDARDLPANIPFFDRVAIDKAKKALAASSRALADAAASASLDDDSATATTEVTELSGFEALGGKPTIVKRKRVVTPSFDRCHICGADPAYHAASACPKCKRCGKRGHVGKRCPLNAATSTP